MSETSENPTVRTSTATAPAPAAVEAAPYRTPRVFLAAAWVAIVAGIVFIVSVIFFTGMALRPSWRSSSPPQAPRGVDASAPHGWSGWSGRRWTRRHPAGRTPVGDPRRARPQPDPVIGRPVPDAVVQQPLAEQPAARCSPEHRAAVSSPAIHRRISIHSKFVGRSCYAGRDPGHHSRHERDTRTLDPADFRRSCTPAPAAAPGAAEAAEALRGRGVGDHRRGDRLHHLHRVLRRCRRLQVLPPLPPSPRPDVRTRRRPRQSRTGQRAVGPGIRPRRAVGPRGTRVDRAHAPRRSGRARRAGRRPRSERARPAADDRRQPGPRYAGTPSIIIGAQGFSSPKPGVSPANEEIAT